MAATKLIVSALLCLGAVACGPSPAPPPPAPPAPAATSGDPVVDALFGSVQRTFERRYPNAEVILAEQAVGQGASTQVCGVAIMIRDTARYRRFFIASAADLTELGNRADRRWTEACENAKPVPGARDADTAIATRP
jgi:hypothetical protein